MKHPLLFVALLILLPQAAFAGSQTYSTPGTYTFTVPQTANGIITIQVWGAGAGGVGGYGSTAGGTGGGGGGYVRNTFQTSQLSQAVTVAVGRGGSGSFGIGNPFILGPWVPKADNGGSSSFGSYLIANGGTGGTGSLAAAQAGNTSMSAPGGSYSGGTGENGGIGGALSGGDNRANETPFPPAKPGGSTSCAGAGGGGGGASFSNRYAGNYQGGAAGMVGASGGTSGCGGRGGAGGNGNYVAGSSGSAPGGGGGGGSGGGFGRYGGIGGTGGNGSVTITWTDAAPTCTMTANNASVMQGGTVNITWTSQNATSAVFSPEWGGEPVNNTRTTSPLQQTTTYTGTFTGAGGTVTCSKTITVFPPSRCTFNGAIVNHGSSVTAYQSSSVAYGSSCTSQTRTCTNGTLSGSYAYSSCSVGSAANCTAPWGATVNHGSSITAYQSSSVAYGQSCAAQTRSCSNGSLSGSYGYSSCSVGAPAAPTATLTSSLGSTVKIGQSSTITATFTVGAGDTLTHANIDSPLGTGKTANTNPGTKTYTFVPSAAGTYTFYARAQTGYYTSWSTYGSPLSVTVPPLPTVTFSADDTSITQGESATLTWSSSNATSCTGTNFSTGTGSPTSGTRVVTPTANTTYTVTCTGTGGSDAKSVTITVSNATPAAPTVTVPSGQIVNVAGSYTFRAADPDGDTVRYAIDWNNNGTTDEWLPASGYVTSNTVRSTNHTWTSSGTKTFKARTQDSDGAYSAWTTSSVSVGPPAPTAVLTAGRGINPVTSYREGDAAFTLQWSSSNATSCTGTNFSTGTGSPTSGTATVPSISANRTYTVTCSGSTNPSGTDAVTVTFTDNQAPSTGSMSISGPTSGIEDVSYTFTFTGTDPESDTLRYGIDWNPSTGIDEWVPASGYVSSGTARTSSHTWSVPGTFTFRALAEDSRGAQSGWKTHTITLSAACIPINGCADDGNVRNSCTGALVQSCSYGCELSECLPPPEPTPSDGGEFIAVPGIVQEGGASSLSWNITDTESCTVTENNPDIDDTWTGTTGERTTSALFQRTTYTLSCDGLDADSVEDDYTAPAVVIVVPVFIEQ